MPLNQLATVSVPEPRLISVQVWDKSMVKAVEKAIVDSNLGLSPATEGQVLRLRIPELNEERRKELVKVAHKYAEAAKVAARHAHADRALPRLARPDQGTRGKAGPRQDRPADLRGAGLRAVPRTTAGLRFASDREGGDHRLQRRQRGRGRRFHRRQDPVRRDRAAGRGDAR